MRIIPLLVALTANPVSASLDFVQELAPLQLATGRTLTARIRRPAEQVAGARLPALMVFGGFETAAEVLSLLHPEKPIILASFDYPYDGPRKFTFPRTLLDALKLRRTLEETQEGIAALTRILRSRHDVDPARIGIVGASFGSPFAVTAAARDPGLSTLILIHGFADLRGALRHRLTQVWSGRMGVLAPPLASASAWVIDLALGLPRPEEDAARLHPDQRALIIEAEQDSMLPLKSRSLLTETLRKSHVKATVLLDPHDHLMPGASQQIDDLLRQATEWLMWD